MDGLSLRSAVGGLSACPSPICRWALGFGIETLTLSPERLTLSHLQVGNFALSQRLGAYFYRGLQFFAVGFGSSMVGHTLTKTLVRPVLPSQPLRA